MSAREWALITFTILTQMSVGFFVALGVVHFFVARKTNMEEADRLSDRALIAAILVVFLGLLASLFHLGNPFTAYRAVTNIGTSWLSREILLGVIFAITGAVFALMQWMKIATFAIRNFIAWIAALVGIAFVYSMSHIYMLPTEPAWDSWATPVTFFVTSFLLGSLAMGIAFVANHAYIQRHEPNCADLQCSLMRDSLRWISVVAIVLLGIELAVLPLYLVSLANGPKAAIATATLISSTYLWALFLRVLFVFIGAGVFAVFLYQNASSPGREKILSNLAYIAFVLVFAGEIIGRYLFYATHVRIGI